MSWLSEAMGSATNNLPNVTGIGDFMDVANPFRTGSTGQGPIDVKTNTPGGTQYSNPAADQLIREATAGMGAVAPLRTELVNQSLNFLRGNQDVTQSPVYSAMLATAEPQYKTARENIIGATPAGGALASQLANLETEKARSYTQSAGQIAENLLNQALGLTSTGYSTGTTALSSAASAQAQQAAAKASERSALINSKGGLYGGAGGSIGSAIGGK